MVGPSSTATGIVFICLLVHQALFFLQPLLSGSLLFGVS